MHSEPGSDTVLTKVRAASNDVHPIWKTIHVAVVMGIACFFMWANASNFDSTEGNALLGMLLILVVYAFGGDGFRLISKLFGNGKG